MNVYNAIKAGDELAKQGWCPYVPHLTHFWHIISPHKWEFWMMLDEEILKRCDAIYMMKGWEDSTGACREHTTAISLGLEIIYG